MEQKDRLKQAREQLGLTQEAFGSNLGLSGANVRDLESGKVKFSLLHAYAIEKILGISAIWLLHHTGSMMLDKDTYLHADSIEGAGTCNDPGSDFVKVPRYQVRASAGGGSMIHSEQVVDHLSFRSDWVRNALGVPVKDLVLINVTGDSMEPTLSEGDLILIDVSHRGMKDNAVYVLQLNGSLLVKRLQQKFDGTIIIKSDNPMYESETVPTDAAGALNIIGRVVWCGRRM